MLKLPFRLMPACLCFALASTLTTLVPAPAAAETHSFAMPARLAATHTGMVQAVAIAFDMPSPTTLAFAHAKPAQIQNDPEQVYLANSRRHFTDDDLACMAEALYFEARGENAQGQAAVAEVILNRVDSRSFPSTVCGVVNQQAQFSYTIGGRKSISNKAAYLRVRKVAEEALAGAPRDLTGGATYFHTPYVRPAWSHRFQRTAQIGGHIFYRGNQRYASN